MTTTTTCPQTVYTDSRDVRGHRCGRPVKDEGLCGVHLAGKRRRQENDAARATERAEDDQREAAAQALCDRLRALGIRAHPHYASHPTRMGRYTGGIALDAEHSTALVALAESAR